MILREESAVAEQHHGHGPQRGTGGDQEHDHHLVESGLERVDAGQQLAGHHAGDTHDPDDHHRVDRGDHPRTDRVLHCGPRGFPAGGAQGQ